MPLLDVENLTVAYGRITALHGVSLHLDEGEAVAVVGANGAGKTTLLMTVAGVHPARAGSVKFAGREISGDRPEDIVRLGCALVPEGRHIFGSLTVAENLRVARTVRKDRVAAQRDLDDMLEMFPALLESLDLRAARLSGGQQQQLAIARALITSPKLMMLDEPSIGLAPLVVDLVFEVLVRLRDRGVSVLLVEQNVNRAIEFADRSYLLTTGNIQAIDDHNGRGVDATALAEAYLGIGEAS